MVSQIARSGDIEASLLLIPVRMLEKTPSTDSPLCQGELSSLPACDDDGSKEPHSSGTLVATPDHAADLDLEGGVFVDLPAGAVGSRLEPGAETVAASTPPAGTVCVSRRLRMGPEGQMFTTSDEIGLPIDPSLVPAGPT